MKSKNLEESKRNLLRAVILPLMVVLLALVATANANAQKYDLTGTKSQITQATEISLSNSTVNKFYYLFRVDDAGEMHYVTFMVGQGHPLEYAQQQTVGKYVVYEFDDYKGKPFNGKLTEGIKQTGEVTITAGNN